jgi:hypothetical protein
MVSLELWIQSVQIDVDDIHKSWRVISISSNPRSS